MTTPTKSIDQMAPDERRALLAQLLREKARTSKTTHPLSYGQRSLWFMNRLAPESPAYNIAFTAYVRSPVDTATMRRVLQTVTDRHASLRTTFKAAEAGPVQEVYGAREAHFEHVDASGLRDDALKQQVVAAYQEPFDLENGPLMRVHLFTRAPEDHVLLFTVHHIVIDGWSLGLVLDEFRTLYDAEQTGVAANLAQPGPSYTEYVDRQNELLAGPQGEQLRGYWHQQLGGKLPLLNIPTDKPRPNDQAFRGASYEFTLGEELLHGLRAVARAERTTLYAVLLAAFQVLLHRYTGQDDIIIGSPMAARTQPEFQRTVGYFVNPVALRANLADNPTFKSFLGQTRQTVLDGLSHQEYPFLRLVEELRPQRDPGRSLIFEALFNLQKVQRLGKMADLMAVGDARVKPAHGELDMAPFLLQQEEGQFDLVIDVIETENALNGALRYNTDLFEDATAVRMYGHFHMLLQGIVAGPEQRIDALPLLPEAERTQLLVDWNATAAPYPAERCLHELVAEQVARTPDAVAASFEGQTLTYQQLDQHSNQLAHHLRARGVGPDVPVGVYMERSRDLLVALLGVLKAGGAYVPLDPAFPTERLAFMLADSSAPVLLTQTELVASAPAHQAQVVCLDADSVAIAAWPKHAPDATATPDNLAYIIFTSGSTGKPKGVLLSHRAVVNFLCAMRHTPGLTERDVLVAVTTLSFDIAVLELFLPLAVGARVELASRETASDGELLRETLEQSGATIMQATPATWRMLLSTDWQCPAGFKALCGGESLPPRVADELLARGVELWNMYGPTETTVWSTVQRITTTDAPIVVGRPIANTQVYIVNSEFQPTPIGVAGELTIGGDGVARGYLNRPELSADRFIANPFVADAHARIYRTGDLARYLADGTIEVLGRIDQQVKVRGFRIELGEIEVALGQHPGIRSAAVVAREDGRGDLRLVAYLVPAGDALPALGELRTFLKATLPDYMVPSAFVPLEALPLTPNGKLNRQALPAPERGRARDDTFAAPTTATEQAIAGVWRDVLSVERVGVYDNFFDLGGHSLLAMDVLGKLEQQFGARVSPALLRAQTLGQFAATYDELLQPAQPAETPAPAAETGRAARMFGAVRRIIGPGTKNS